MLKSSIKSKVRFFYNDKGYYFKDSLKLRKFIERIFKQEGAGLKEMNYIFCSDKELLAINKQYLHHDYLTDIITFNLSQSKHSIVGESYISIDRVRDNAKNLNSSIKKELLRVVFHGPLHLCGYNDKTNKSIRLIRNREDYYISLFLNV